MSAAQPLVILSRSAPYGNHQPRAALDVALTAAAFEQKVTVVFIEDGVLQLVKAQGDSRQKNISRLVRALKVYEVERLFYHKESLLKLGLSHEMLLDEADAIDDESLKTLVTGAGNVLVF